MSDKQFSFSELSADAKQRAVKDFAIFYVHQYQNNDMELIASFDRDGLIQDINQDLYINCFNLESTIISDSVSERFSKYANLLNLIDQKYYATGNPEQDWPDWYAAKFATIQKGL